MFFNYEKSTFVLPFCIGCHVNRLLQLKPTIAAWLFVRHLKWCPIDSIQSCFDTNHFTSIWSRCNTHLKLIWWMQTEVTIQYKTLRYLAVWNHYRISRLAIDKRYWTICSTVRWVWLPFESGWFQRKRSSHSVSGKSSKTNMIFLLLRWHSFDFHWGISSSSLLLWTTSVKLYQVDFSLCRINFRCVSK